VPRFIGHDLGATPQACLRNRYPDLPGLRWGSADHCRNVEPLHRRPSGHREDPRPPRCDSAGVTPPPPNYDRVYIIPQFADFNSGDAQLSELYADLDATGTLLWTRSPDSYPFFFGNSFALLDGVFSLRITATTGQFSVDPYAYGQTSEGNTSNVTPTVAGVPTPATATLLVMGLVSIVWKRRRIARQW
jgi:hypothetical protein